MSRTGTEEGGRRRFGRGPEGDRAEGGFTLLELVVAMSLLAIVALGFAASVGMGFKTIAAARQRQTASEIASARLEHLRSIPYELVALSTAPAHSADPDNPDHGVSVGGDAYDVSGEGDYEALIVDTTDGLLLHLEDPVKVGSTVMEIYQYATWVDDPGIVGTQDYRRVTVVVKYKTPAVTGVTRVVRVSSLFTDGTVTITVPPTTFPPPTTLPPPTTVPPTVPPTTAPPSVCSGDTAPPAGEFTVGAAGGEAELGYTAGTNVNVTLDLADDCTPITVRLSNDGFVYGDPVPWSDASPTLSWSLSAGDGTKTIHALVRDAAGNEQLLEAQQIILDTTAPTVPATLTRSVSCSGSNRTVNLNWGVSSDTNLRGYRVYRSTDGATWSAIDTTTASNSSNTHSKGLDTVRFRVVGYDKAGNESDATNIVSLAKNQCS